MRFALGIEYNGTSFYGWQAQENLPTIQGALEKALTHIAGESIKVFCAGRTDAGVHATGQIVHFDTSTIRNNRAWTLGTSTYLPPAISIRWIQEVDDTFHARFSARSRRYRYIIYNRPLRAALFASRATWCYQPLDIKPMQLAASYLIGDQDFSSFRSAQCESRSPMRNVQKLTVFSQDDFIIIEIEANAFLHHMVRNIAGVLMKIGTHLAGPDWMLEVLHARDRKAAAKTAPADGLYLTHVSYPEKYVFPNNSPPILLL